MRDSDASGGGSRVQLSKSEFLCEVIVIKGMESGSSHVLRLGYDTGIISVNVFIIVTPGDPVD